MTIQKLKSSILTMKLNKLMSNHPKPTLQISLYAIYLQKKTHSTPLLSKGGYGSFMMLQVKLLNKLSFQGLFQWIHYLIYLFETKIHFPLSYFRNWFFFETRLSFFFSSFNLSCGEFFHLKFIGAKPLPLPLSLPLPLPLPSSSQGKS